MELPFKCFEKSIQLHKYLNNKENKNYTLLSHPKSILKPCFRVLTREGITIAVGTFHDTNGKIETHIVNDSITELTDGCYHRNEEELYQYVSEWVLDKNKIIFIN